jgi:hypothetical protein
VIDSIGLVDDRSNTGSEHGDPRLTGRVDRTKKVHRDQPKKRVAFG